MPYLPQDEDLSADASLSRALELLARGQPACRTSLERGVSGELGKIIVDLIPDLPSGYVKIAIENGDL